VNNDSGPSPFAFHIPPESDFSISRNPYSPFPGTLIHMPRIPHLCFSAIQRFRESAVPAARYTTERAPPWRLQIYKPPKHRS
ncbi:MAG TPA: hypothetical protein VKX39_12965, partial [Bryobacteraceae bacterium]|nr:hypothetical protein [Bryobacteraceae bacterium]